MWYNKSQFVHEMSTKLFDISTKTSKPLCDLRYQWCADRIYPTWWRYVLTAHW